jgi:AcrR family transcriptional regulator
MPAKVPERIRDAKRSREAILAAAEASFAEHGYDASSLGEIAAGAGLSRGTPSYFFGSKERLYLEVIERSFAAREEAARAAFAPVHDWCSGGGELDALRRALTSAATAYVRFLVERPAFVKLVMREELSGAESVHARRTKSTAMEDAFTALAAAGAERGLLTFEVGDAVVLFVSLTFAPVAFSHSFMRAVRRDLRTPAVRQAQVTLAVEQMMHLLAG